MGILSLVGDHLRFPKAMLWGICSKVGRESTSSMFEPRIE